MRVLALSLVGLFLLTVSASSGGEKSDDVLKKIQGTWKFIKHEMGGKDMPADALKGMEITFKGDNWTVTKDGKVLQGGTHKFDASKKPPHVDAVVTEGEGKGEKMIGIFELKGDTLHVCFDVTGKERPTSIKANDTQFAAVVVREKKKAD